MTNHYRRRCRHGGRSRHHRRHRPHRALLSPFSSPSSSIELAQDHVEMKNCHCAKSEQETPTE